MIIKGKVVKGKQRGKSLGFPTANIALTQKIPEGIYISKTRFNNKTKPSITFIGVAETFNERILQAETFILDFKGDLYGKLIQVELIEKIRESKKFENEKELIDTMKEDERITRVYWDNKS